MILVGGCSVSERSLVSVRFDDGVFPMGFGYSTSIRDADNRTKIQLFIHFASSQTVHNDKIYSSVFEIFHAQESHQSDIQVRNAYYAFVGEFLLISIFRLFRRSGQQIYNVTLFFLFFMSLYSLLGVQLFGELNNHCVLNTTDPK